MNRIRKSGTPSASYPAWFSNHYLARNATNSSRKAVSKRTMRVIIGRWTVGGGGTPYQYPNVGLGVCTKDKVKDHAPIKSTSAKAEFATYVPVLLLYEAFAPHCQRQLASTRPVAEKYRCCRQRYLVKENLNNMVSTTS